MGSPREKIGEGGRENEEGTLLGLQGQLNAPRSPPTYKSLQEARAESVCSLFQEDQVFHCWHAGSSASERVCKTVLDVAPSSLYTITLCLSDNWCLITFTTIYAILLGTSRLSGFGQSSETVVKIIYEPIHIHFTTTLSFLDKSSASAKTPRVSCPVQDCPFPTQNGRVWSRSDGSRPCNPVKGLAGLSETRA